MRMYTGRKKRGREGYTGEGKKKKIRKQGMVRMDARIQEVREDRLREIGREVSEERRREKCK